MITCVHRHPKAGKAIAEGLKNPKAGKTVLYLVGSHQEIEWGDSCRARPCDTS